MNKDIDNILGNVGRIADEIKVRVFSVGGHVRDTILGRSIKEVDFVVEGDGPGFAKVVKERFKGSRLIVYKKFGTASFHVKDLRLEFVSARSESYVEHSRKPIVKKSSLHDDLSRRDFTINTMAMVLNKDNFGQILDPFNGRSDLRKKLLRTPLEPASTFSDDPLRIMRAARFASQLNFQIENETFQGMKKERKRLGIVSQERITDEFLKILASPKPSVGLQILLKSKVLEVVFPELVSLVGVEQRDKYHHKDVFEHTMKVLDNLAEKSDNIKLRFSALMHDIGKPKVKRFVKGTGWTFHAHEQIGVRMLKKMGPRLRLPREFIKYAQRMTQLHMRPIHLIDENVTDSAIRRLIVQAENDLEDLMMLCRADITSGNPKRVKKHLANFDHIAERIAEVEEKDKMRAFQSPVRGEEIMRICGLRPGPMVGKLKKMIEEAILEGEISNEHDAAFDYLLKIKDKMIMSAE